MVFNQPNQLQYTTLCVVNMISNKEKFGQKHTNKGKFHYVMFESKSR